MTQAVDKLPALYLNVIRERASQIAFLHEL